MLFRWFVNLSIQAEVFDASTYSKNQARLLGHEVADLFFAEVVELPRRHSWLSNDHFSVGSRLIEAWAALTSFKPKGTDQGPGGGNVESVQNGRTHSNATHESTTDQ